MGPAHSGSERERLIRQADTFAADASWLLEQAEVRPGWRCADIGCGPLGIINLLSERVGAAGEVVGVENDPQAIVKTQEVVAARGLRNVSLTLADATDTGLELSSFDFAHARLLLLRSPHPERVVREMSALICPAGTVALQESDWVSWVCQPPASGVGSSPGGAGGVRPPPGTRPVCPAGSSPRGLWTTVCWRPANPIISLMS